MPIWEHEAPDHLKDFDAKENDNDDYHEVEDDPNYRVFWDYRYTSVDQKYFFTEQLKILQKLILNANPPILTDRESQIKPFKEDIDLFNHEFEEKFVFNSTDLTKCSEITKQTEKSLKYEAQCNVWGNWTIVDSCPKCGAGNYTETRKCFNSERTGAFRLKSISLKNTINEDL